MRASRMIELAITAIAGAAVLASPAQAQVGRNETGGVCLGLYCDPGAPNGGGGTNAYGGMCLGPYCEQAVRPDPYVPYSTVRPDDPSGPPLYPSPYRSYERPSNPFSGPPGYDGN